MQQNDNKYLMVLCKDKPEDPIDFGYTLYFINNTEENIECLKIRPETIKADYDEETEVAQITDESMYLEPQSYSIINSMDEMDIPFNVCYDAYIKTKDSEIIEIFDIKQLDVVDLEISPVPILNRYGYILTAVS